MRKKKKTSGVHTPQDVLKAVMAGASAAMMGTTLLEHGSGRLMYILTDLQSWTECEPFVIKMTHPVTRM